MVAAAVAEGVQAIRRQKIIKGALVAAVILYVLYKFSSCGKENQVVSSEAEIKRKLFGECGSKPTVVARKMPGSGGSGTQQSPIGKDGHGQAPTSQPYGQDGSGRRPGMFGENGSGRRPGMFGENGSGTMKPQTVRFA